MQKKPTFPVRYLLPAGLLLLSASFIVPRLASVPDVVDGFLKGISIGLLALSLIYKLKIKQAA